jgi:hypothetical protein
LGLRWPFPTGGQYALCNVAGNELMDKVKGGVEYTAAKLKEKIDKGAEKLGLDTDSPEVLESRTKVCMAGGLDQHTQLQRGWGWLSQSSVFACTKCTQDQIWLGKIGCFCEPNLDL